MRSERAVNSSSTSSGSRPTHAHPDWLVPEGFPAEVGALMSTRAGGVSQGACAGLNLRPSTLPPGTWDEPAHIAENQHRFANALEGAAPVYLSQVHGTRVLRLSHADLPAAGEHPEADACITTERGLACLVMVADCLPVLLAAPEGRGVGAAHAGWRGLAGGVVEATLHDLCAATGDRPSDIQAWLGACIGPEHFEVGDEVREAFGPAAAGCFRPGAQAGKWWADLPALARLRLHQAGVEHVSGGQWCTVADASRFYSYRRDRDTGRHAAAIWIR
jgi:polyphenol oxidase